MASSDSVGEQPRGRVLVLASDHRPAVSGVGVYVDQLSRHLAPAWETTVAAPGAMVDGRALQFRALPSTGPSSFSVSRLIEWSSLMGFLSGRAERPDIIHAHGFMSAIPAALASEAWGVPWVLTKHCWLEDYDTAPDVAFELQSWSIRNADAVVAPSQWLARRVRQEAGNAVEVQVIASDSEVPEPQPEVIPAGAGRIFVHSGAQYHKGLDLSLAAFLEVAEPQDRLLVVGSVEERLRRDAERVTDHRITWLGHQPQQAAWETYRQATAMLAPSRSDGFPLAVIEAQKLGVPVLGTTESSIPEIITEGVTGCCVAPESFPDLVAGFSREALAPPEEIRRIARSRFSWAATATQYGQLFSRIIARYSDGVTPTTARN